MAKIRDSSFLPRLSVRRPVTVVMIFVALLVVGFIAYTRIPLEMMPQGYDLPFMGVYVPYPNASPEEIEDQITRPIEQIIGTVRNVHTTRSNIGRDYTFVFVQFNQGTDMDLAYAELRDRMDRVKSELPNDVERIYLRRWRMGSDAEMWIALTVNRNYPDLYYQLDHYLANKVRRIGGVASVDIEGAGEKSFEIELDMDKVSAHRINLYELVEELRRSNFAIPSGHVGEGDKRFYIRAMGRFTNIDEIKQLEVRPGVLLGDVATVSFREPKDLTQVRIDNEKGIWLSVQKEASANSVEVYQNVMAILKDELAENPNLEGIKYNYVFAQGDLIINSIADLQETAIWAALFAVIVLFFFLRHVRMTLVITLAIPISLMATVVVMYFTGETLNLISLMGLMVCVGLVVDNSVVVVENIFRHRKAGDAPDTAAIKGASEVSQAVLMATMTTIVVFLPLMLMTGDEMMSFMMSRLGFPVIFALLSSLLVALVFIPLATTRFKDKGRIGSSRLIDWTRDLYVNSLRWVLAHRVEAVILSLLILIAVLTFTSDVGYQGEMEDAIDTRVHLRFAKRYSDISAGPMQLAARVEAWCEANRKLLDYDVKSLWVSNERVTATLFRSPKRNSTSMEEKPLLWAKNILFLNDMQRDPEIERRKFIRENMLNDLGLIEGEVELFLGGGADANERGTLNVVLEGPDYDELRRWGERVRAELSTIPQVINVETDIESGREELAISIDRESARTANVDTNWAVYTVSNALRGVQLPRFQDREREIRIMVRLQEADRQSIEDFKNLRIPTLDGREVPLSAIAVFDYSRGPATMTHYNKKPNYNITITFETDRLDEMMPIVAGAMRNLGNGTGYTYSFGERALRMMEETENFGFAALLAVVFVFLLMGVLFESFALPLTIITCIPFAFAGSYLLLKIYRMPVNMFAFIGIVIIIGVVVNNGIVLVDLINRQRRKGMDREQAITLAGYYRFRPILMTAGTTIFSLLPMAFGDANMVGMPFNPLGIAMIGGLALNSLLTLLLVPVFYTIFDDMKKVWHWLTGLLFGLGRRAEASARAAAQK
jgi:HAE1 family hydrophobic/amphiphilic exporter-1